MFALRHKLSAFQVFLILQAGFVCSSTIVYTTYMVYRVTVAGLNPLQLMLLGTLMEVTSMVFQIPTGLLADVYSRRLSIIIGIMLMGSAFVIEGFLPNFLAILLAQIPWAIGFTFWSGALEAWIADEIGDDRKIAHVYLRGAQVGLVGSLIGAPISVALASIHLNIPVIVGGILLVVVGFFLILAMPERSFKHTRQEHANPLQGVTSALKDSWRLVRIRPILVTILLIDIFFGLSSEGFDRLWTAHFLADFQIPALGNFKPIVWFGIISIFATLLSLATAEIIRKYVPLDRHIMVARSLFIITSLMIVSLIVFALTGSFYLAVIAYLVASSLRQIVSPIYITWLTQNTPSHIRATMLSICGEFDAFGQIVGGPVVGAIGTFTSLRVAMVVIGGVLFPALPLFIRTIHQSQADEMVKQGEKEMIPLDSSEIVD